MVVLPTALIAVVSSILLFSVAIFTLVRNVISALEIRAGIPVSYAFLPHGTFDWFFFPSNFYILLGATVLISSISLIAIGKRISRTPGNIILGLFSYAFLYGFVVPFWLLRATADVTFGKHRSWR